MLTAGRKTPHGHQPRHTGEGVAIVLMDQAIPAWKAGGEQGKSWGSRIIKATLRGSSRKTNHLHIFSCYAPTLPQAELKRKHSLTIYSKLLDEIPSNETYLILGNFNAHVGLRDPFEEEDHWEKSRGPHGFGKINDAGEERLSFEFLNEATVCNTWFQKKDAYKCTW